MIWVIVATVLIALALLTPACVWVIERTYRPFGRFVDVAGGRLHVVELGPATEAPPVVLLHGASSNLESMRQPLGDLLAARHRVILIDRPGHGFSTRDRAADGAAATQAAMIDEALGKLGVTRAIIVGHSWSGALGAALALNHPARVAGLVLLAPVTHPWPGGVSWYSTVATLPVMGWLFTRLIATPVGLLMTPSGTASVFAPQPMPANYVRDVAIPLLMRPREFTANAWDIVMLKPSVAAQVARYPQITAPTVVISGDVDKTVSIGIHSRPFAATVRGARLIELPGVGHMPQNAAPDIVVQAIEELIARSTTPAAIAAE